MANLGSSILVPGVYVTIDNSLANTSLGESFKTCLIGQRLTIGTVAAEVFTKVFSAQDATEKFGSGSMLSTMFAEWFKNNTANEVYAIALDDAGGATSFANAVTFSGTATAVGEIYTYLNGHRFVTAVSIGDTAINVAANISSTVAADLTTIGLVGALDGAGKITFSTWNKGVALVADVRFNVGNGEAFPAGITAALVETAGTVDPDINDAIAALPDEVIKIIVNPYTDATSTTALKTELDRRWENTVQVDGHAIMATGGTSSEVTTFGDTLNSEHFSFIDAGKNTLVPPYLVAPEVAGRVALSADADPARPYRTLPITGMIGDAPTDRRNFNEKNAILNSGIGIHTVQNDSTVTIERMVTTYKENAVGAPDNSYQNTPTMLNLSFLRQSFKTRMLSLYPRHKLADDGTSFGAGQPIATPSTIKGNIIKLYEDWINLGLAENVDAFAETLTVERDAVNRSRVNVNMNPILVGQLYQFDANLQFIV